MCCSQERNVGAGGGGRGGGGVFASVNSQSNAMVVIRAKNKLQFISWSEREGEGGDGRETERREKRRKRQRREKKRENGDRVDEHKQVNRQAQRPTEKGKHQRSEVNGHEKSRLAST